MFIFALAFGLLFSIFAVAVFKNSYENQEISKKFSDSDGVIQEKLEGKYFYVSWFILFLLGFVMAYVIPFIFAGITLFIIISVLSGKRK